MSSGRTLAVPPLGAPLETIDQPARLRSRSLEAWALGLALLLGLFHGLLYVFLVPPWQHYDEPSHFEYAWLVAQRGVLPQPGDFDPALTRSLLASKIAHGFYAGQASPPDLAGPGAPQQMDGYSQLDEPPLYYLLVAAPLALLGSLDVASQLYAGRLVSLALYLLTLLAAWGAARELAPPGSPLRWMLPVSLALLPGLVDSLTALNNDAAAVAFFSLFLWGALRLLKRGFSWPGLLWVCAAAGLCLFTKTTVYLALPLLGVVLLFVFLPGRRWLAWTLLGIAALLGLGAALGWDAPASWYRSSAQAAPLRLASPQAVAGGYVLQIDAQAGSTPGWLVPLFQPLPLQTGRSLAGKVVTLGAWMWASRPVQARLPVLNQGDQAFSQGVSLSSTPAFYAFQAALDRHSSRLWVSLDPGLPRSEGDITVYYDGLVLAEGAYPLQETPRFSDPDGSQGRWGGLPFANLLRNASAEGAGPGVRAWADDLGARVLPDSTRPSLVLTSLLDANGAGWFYRESVLRLLRTFWGMFGWGHVPLLGYQPYRWLGALTLLGLAGAALGLWRLRRALPWSLLLLLALALLGIWGATLVRGPIYLAVPRLYLPVARYAYPAILPTLLVLDLGWLELARSFAHLARPLWSRLAPSQPGAAGGRIWPALGPAAFFLLFAALDLLAILSIIKFYNASG